VENENQRALTPKRTKRRHDCRSPGESLRFAIQKPTGTKWRVQLGKRFTGGRRVTHDVSSIQAAKEWIFSDAQKLKADPGSLLDLKARAGSTVFELSSAQINEAVAAIKRLKGTTIGMTLAEAIDYAIKHHRPDAGVISVAEAIEKALARKKSKSKSYKDNLGRRWRRFERWLPPAKRKAIHTVTQLDVRRFLSGCDLEPQGEGNELRNLSVLFSWAVQFHHMTVNPCKGIQTEESGEKEPPRVLTIKEVKELIDLALTEIKELIRVGKGKSGKGKMSIITVHPGDLIPWLTIGLF
jgi:ribosomal protein L7/L12